MSGPESSPRERIPAFVVAGARPNFMKVAALWDAFNRCPHPFAPVFINTGQHYDEKLSRVFQAEFGLPEPDVELGVGSGTHGEQTGKVMVLFEKVCLERRPGLIIVVGDVNSTMGAALVGAKLRIPVAHVEAGLRSFDRDMPEEINRLVTDAVSDFLFTPSLDGNENLRKEGIPDSRIHFVGNVMADTLLRFEKRAESLRFWKSQSLKRGAYGLVTLHRPSNVDSRSSFEEILGALSKIQKKVPLLFPAHPRTVERLRAMGFDRLLEKSPNLRLVEPLGYVEFLSLMIGASFVLTDSGGVQEETTMVGTPCLTLRRNTERPVTVEKGTNCLVLPENDKIVNAVFGLSSRANGKKRRRPELWDGRAAVRIVRILRDIFEK